MPEFVVQVLGIRFALSCALQSRRDSRGWRQGLDFVYRVHATFLLQIIYLIMILREEEICGFNGKQDFL